MFNRALALELLAFTQICPSETLYDFRRVGRKNVLVFRGTATSRELLYDLKATKTSFREGRVHSGFLNLYKSVRGEISAVVPDIICGYSLGAAMAVLAASEASNSPIVYTFASPKVGDDRFADWYNTCMSSPTYCVRNEDDVITRLPFLNTHVGTEVVFARDAGSILDNHSYDTYRDAISEMSISVVPKKLWFQ